MENWLEETLPCTKVSSELSACYSETPTGRSDLSVRFVNVYSFKNKKKRAELLELETPEVQIDLPVCIVHVMFTAGL